MQATIAKAVAGLVLVGGSLVGCHTVDPHQACRDSRPYGLTPSYIFAARQDVINGEQHYRCDGNLPIGRRCWLVRHWDHQTFVAGGDLYCP
jgi:hypothetical protein